MAPGSQREEAVTDWHCLPREIRDLILENAAGHESGAASYAAVSKEWKAFFESRTFRRLKVKAHDINMLAALSEDHRRCVQHIWLDYDFSPQACVYCLDSPADILNYRNEDDGAVKAWFSRSDLEKFGHTLSRLSKAVCQWPRTVSGLTLELSGQPLDVDDHYGGRICFGNNDTAEHAVAHGQDPLASIDTSTWHDPTHGWTHGTPDPVLIEDEQTCFELLNNTIHLKRFTLYHQLVEFQMSDESYLEAFVSVVDYISPMGRKPKMNSVQGFGRLSTKLEHLSVSFVIDADRFFLQCAKESTWTWPDLRSLMLTCGDLGEPEQTRRSNLLLTAARVVRRMPQLQQLVLWWATPEDACAFLFDRRHSLEYDVRSEVSITWRRKDLPELPKEVVSTWRGVAQKYGALDIEVINEHLPSTPFSSQAEAIHALRLPEGIIDPVSLWQMRREANRNWQSSA
ncbi:uncharacterized protein F5Z01DRAFT_676768 [Emericellopsis atlantica]|uniref:DUF6546 domain-containing protein n=1 Tax=Emericellopsis atlantica TaxID=2614577 RepID=A0A9P8CLM9_9HYPO|nr:uncharacterized protein F5Z01DRAFT_676768 [Emericellopsis atlantica]KAG9251578.1 hypothetical protein F5Z01DRAFT_676768 [Emericellopsis atlantica]